MRTYQKTKGVGGALGAGCMEESKVEICACTPGVMSCQIELDLAVGSERTRVKFPLCHGSSSDDFGSVTLNLIYLTVWCF